MSNANNNPQGGRAAGSAGPQPQPPMYQPQPNRGNRFFAWIRSSRIMRGRNRWVAGVCDGVARRLGWSATLVRALVILTSLLFGAGAAFYALAWFLLPDETDGRILCEELINGHWDWNCAGALVCAAVALCLPGAGWLAFGVAVLVFWLLVNRQSYAASWQPPQAGGPWPGQPTQPTQPGQPARPAQSQYMPRPMPANTATAANMSGMTGQPMPQPTRPTPSSYQPYARPAQSPYQTFQQPVSPPAAFATSNVPPTFTAPPTAVAPQPKRARRKPAGPLLVLVTLGVALLAIAGTGWYATTMTVDWDYALRVLRLATLCCGGICLGIGVLIVVLGCMGRRAGGLHPLAWFAAFMAVAMTFCTGAVAWESRGWMMSDDYHRMTVSGTVTWSDTSDAQMKRYEQGLVVVGKNYANDVLDIDLSGYPAAHGKHKVKLDDGTYGESSCPTGELNLVVVNAQVVVTLPDGCQWSVSDKDSGYTNVTDYVGGPDGLTFFNGTGFMGLSLDEDDGSVPGHHGVNKGVPALDGTTDPEDSDDDGSDDADDQDESDESDTEDDPYDSVYDGTDLDKAFKTIYENKWYWPSIDSDKAPEEPDLYVNVDGTVGGSVTMQYASDSKLPLGTTGGQSHGSTGGKNTNGKNAEGKSAEGKETK